MRVVAPLFTLLLVLLSGCGAEESGDVTPLVPGDTTEATRTDYEIILVGSMPDTLTGAAHVGDVVDAQTQQTVTVIRMDAGFDFGGGFFITHGAGTLPGPGQYPITPFPADSIRQRGLPQGFSARYRRGLLINLRATDGTLTLDSVTDTLVTGSFDVSMAGQIALPGGTPREGTVRALGTFEAHPTGAGYILGF